MSIGAMTHVAVARRTPPPAPLQAESTDLARTATAAREPAGQGSAVTQAIDVLTAYIPTEILTIYVATIAALEPSEHPVLPAGWIAFWIFFASTPIVVWLVFAAKVRSAGGPLPLKPAEWPKWEMIAATIAFTAWAVALPGTPFREFPVYEPSVAGILVMVIAAALGLITPVIHPVPSRP